MHCKPWLKSGATPWHGRQNQAKQLRFQPLFLAALDGSWWGSLVYIGINALIAIVFGVPKHQLLVQSKLTIASGWLLRFQPPQERLHLHHRCNLWCNLMAKNNLIQMTQIIKYSLGTDTLFLVQNFYLSKYSWLCYIIIVNIVIIRIIESINIITILRRRPIYDLGSTNSFSGINATWRKYNRDSIIKTLQCNTIYELISIKCTIDYWNAKNKKMTIIANNNDSINFTTYS